MSCMRGRDWRASMAGWRAHARDGMDMDAVGYEGFVFKKSRDFWGLTRVGSNERSDDQQDPKEVRRARRARLPRSRGLRDERARARESRTGDNTSFKKVVADVARTAIIGVGLG